MVSETRLVSQETDLDIKKVRKSKVNVAVEIATSPQKVVTVSLRAPQSGCQEMAFTVESQGLPTCNPMMSVQRRANQNWQPTSPVGSYSICQSSPWAKAARGPKQPVSQSSPWAGAAREPKQPVSWSSPWAGAVPGLARDSRLLRSPPHPNAGRKNRLAPETGMLIERIECQPTEQFRIEVGTFGRHAFFQ